MFRWYVVNTYTGHEHKVKANLEHRIESMGQRPRFRRGFVEMIATDGVRLPNRPPDLFAPGVIQEGRVTGPLQLAGFAGLLIPVWTR